MKLEQKATYARDNWWEWSVWVEGDKDELKQIQYVEYTLHSSFPEPVQRVEDRSTKFCLKSAGWGEFTIRAMVVNKDGERKNLRHRLELTYPHEEGNSTTDEAANKEVATLSPVIFLSCNISDSLFANALSKALIGKGASVQMVGNLPGNLPLEASINRLLEQADYAVFIISEALSSWMGREIDAVGKHKIPIIPVIIVSSKVNVSLLPPKVRKAIPIKPVPPERFDDESEDVAARIYKEIAALSGKKKAAKPA